jgi:hypothetical protein
MDNHRIEVVENVVNGRQSVQWVAAKLDRCGKTIKRYVTRLRKNPGDDLIHKSRWNTLQELYKHQQYIISGTMVY